MTVRPEYANEFSSAFSTAFDPDLTPGGAIITVEDLPDSVTGSIDPALLQTLVDGANAKAGRVAPCLVDDDPPPSEAQLAEARLILIGAVTRWSQTGSGAYQQQTAGPFSVSIDTRQRGGYNLWPSEIEELQDICSEGKGGKAFAVDTVPWLSVVHSPICSANDYRNAPYWKAYCTCGADIAGRPIYEPDC